MSVVPSASSGIGPRTVMTWPLPMWAWLSSPAFCSIIADGPAARPQTAAC